MYIATLITLLPSIERTATLSTLLYIQYLATSLSELLSFKFKYIATLQLRDYIAMY